jgi:hypothetical protein
VNRVIWFSFCVDFAHPFLASPKMTTKSILLLIFGLVTPVYAQLKWEQPKQTLFPQPSDKMVTAKYRFTNTSSSPVTIVDVRPSCGCTTATLAKKTYASGESGEIDATFNFAGHVGHQEKWIYVSTNLAGSQPALLSLVVDIPPDVTIQPDFVMWRIGDPLAPKTMRVSIPDGIPAKMVAVQTDNPRMQAQLNELPDGNEWEVTITPTETSEPVEAIVAIRSDYPAEHPITYRAYARVK